MFTNPLEFDVVLRARASHVNLVIAAVRRQVVGGNGGESGPEGVVSFFFGKHTTIHHVARRNEPLGNAALALSRRRQRWLCLCFTLVLLLFLLLLLLAWLVVASVCCCFSY